MENYVTLFDHRFLPQGLALYDSLVRQGSPCHLWVLCMDLLVEEQLQQLGLPHLTHLPLADLETEALRQAKATRTWAEYCWTLTPFALSAVFRRCPQAKRITYVDADVCFFGAPSILLAELEGSRKPVLVTEHAFDPRFAARAETVGRFCVQFLTIGNEPAAKDILHDWGEKCLESCTARHGRTSGVFGDQKYLDDWPSRFGDHVHILQGRVQTLAPWNVDFYMSQGGHQYWPVLYHFHGFRILGPRYARISGTYPVTKADHLYEAYLGVLARQVTFMAEHGIPLPCTPLSSETHWVLRNLKRWLFQRMVIRKHNLVTCTPGAVARRGRV